MYRATPNFHPHILLLGCRTSWRVTRYLWNFPLWGYEHPKDCTVTYPRECCEGSVQAVYKPSSDGNETRGRNWIMLWQRAQNLRFQRKTHCMCIISFYLVVYMIVFDAALFVGVAQFRYLGTTITNQNLIQEEIKKRLNSGNACYHSVQNLLSSRLLSRN
jgi:hypothetical protein